MSGPADSSQRYARDVAQLRDHYDEADLAMLLRGAPSSTPDEVSIAKDGRRLDSAAAVTSFFDELRESLAAESAG